MYQYTYIESKACTIYILPTSVCVCMAVYVYVCVYLCKF